MLSAHIFLVIDKVRREVTAIELHTFNNIQLIFQTSAFFNSDHAFFADFIHGFSNDVTDVRIAVGRDSTYLSHFFRLRARLGQCGDFSNSNNDCFVDTTLKVHWVHTGSY